MAKQIIIPSKPFKGPGMPVVVPPRTAASVHLPGRRALPPMREQITRSRITRNF
ncbi:MAG: hypothetical protein ISQ14_11415 [Verrucomicrobiae bacterium]|nr:hypothetical protein [Verrucomicrobiae bacterium]